MPKIIINQKQREALTTVEKNLEEIAAIDRMRNRGKNSVLCITTRTGRKLAKEVSVTGRLASRIESVLIQHRASLVKEIQTISAKYMIELTPEEEASLDPSGDDEAIDDEDFFDEDGLEEEEDASSGEGEYEEDDEEVEDTEESSYDDEGQEDYAEAETTEDPSHYHQANIV